MTEHTITVDVYARRGESNPAYRIYVDRDLLTERDFIWATHEIFVRENIIVNLLPGTHVLRVEQINSNGSIQTKNITVDDAVSANEFTITE